MNEKPAVSVNLAPARCCQVKDQMSYDDTRTISSGNQAILADSPAIPILDK